MRVRKGCRPRSAAFFAGALLTKKLSSCMIKDGCVYGMSGRLLNEDRFETEAV